MVATDRLSAFDVILGEPIPGKGALLTQMALFWFDKLEGIVPNHLTGEVAGIGGAGRRGGAGARALDAGQAPEAAADRGGRARLPGRLGLEGISRRTPVGVRRRAACRPEERVEACPQPIFTPATKAEAGEHDENISFKVASAMIGERAREQACATLSIALYQRAAEYALTKGIIIADTKFEFGLDDQGTLTLMDEVLTPDSSRYWPVEGYVEGQQPAQLRQAVRARLARVACASTAQPWNKKRTGAGDARRCRRKNRRQIPRSVRTADRRPVLDTPRHLLHAHVPPDRSTRRTDRPG